MSYSIEIKEWETKSILDNYIESSNHKIVIINNAEETPQKFYSISILCNTILVEIIIFSYGLSTKPEVSFFENRQLAIIGYDFWLVWIDTNDANIIKTLRLNGFFYEFMFINKFDEIVVVYETGITKIDINCNEIWNIDTDIIEKFNIGSCNNLIVKVMNNPSDIIISIDSGKLLSG